MIGEGYESPETCNQNVRGFGAAYVCGQVQTLWFQGCCGGRRLGRLREARTRSQLGLDSRTSLFMGS